MPSALPQGETPPLDGTLPDVALQNISTIPFSFYLHVPYCKSRCGYCDFNTYIANELDHHKQSDWLAATKREILLAKQIMGSTAPVESVFVGGGTPTLLPANELVAALVCIRDNFQVSSTMEVTTEANPDSVSLESLSRLREAGFNRISFGVQSFRASVLQVLDRTHDQDNVFRAIDWAKSAGFSNISIDLIYGAPGETIEDVEYSIQKFLDLDIQHISAYALIVEDGTQLSRKVKSGLIAAPDDDLMADKYELIDEMLHQAGFTWYEISNWSKPTFESQHNLHYWKNHNWWGVGPGAHSHINGVRWWNVKLPGDWAKKLAANQSPAYAREQLSDTQIQTEHIMLNLRLAEGIRCELVEAEAIQILQRDQLIRIVNQQLVLTRKGRLLADYVVRILTT
jgi:oxygen-independent coproporphyrinogen-3 oxidase